MNKNDRNTETNAADNQNQTNKAQISYSLSDVNEEPQMGSGYAVRGYNVRLKDLAKLEFDPLAEDYERYQRNKYTEQHRLNRMRAEAERKEKNAKRVLLALGIFVALLIFSTICSSFDEKDSAPNGMPPLDRPLNGTILCGREYDGSKITVTADSSHDCVVMIKNLYGAEYVSFYVRGGETVTVDVPSECLYVYFASGKNWYGYGKGLMFGKNTSYSMDDTLLDCTNGRSWRYTLYPVTNGNFSETPIDEDEFFS